MLICLIALVAASLHAFVAGLAEQVAPNPVSHPSTLELALIAAGILAVYVTVKRSIRRGTRTFVNRSPSVAAASTESTTAQSSRDAA